MNLTYFNCSEEFSWSNLFLFDALRLSSHVLPSSCDDLDDISRQMDGFGSFFPSIPLSPVHCFTHPSVICVNLSFLYQESLDYFILYESGLSRNSLSTFLKNVMTEISTTTYYPTDDENMAEDSLKWEIFTSFLSLNFNISFPIPQFGFSSLDRHNLDILFGSCIIMELLDHGWLLILLESFPY